MNLSVLTTPSQQSSELTYDVLVENQEDGREMEEYYQKLDAEDESK
jgi:hypothetical protein